MKESKKIVIRILALLGTLLCLTGLLVYTIDPFYVYHEPWFQIEPYLDEAVYQTPGAAKNFTYDSVILGSSMVENFDIDKFNKLYGWDTVKLAYSAALMGDYASILPLIFETHKVENMVFPIDNYTMIEEETSSYVPRPDYLYDDFLWNDVSYLLNMDVIQRAGKVLAKRLKNQQPAYHTSYFWERTDFSTFTVMKSYLYERRNTAWNEVEEDFLVENALENAEIIGAYIRQYPDTTFYLFFPPYNVMFWDYKILMGHKDATIKMNQEIMEYFLQFENVRLYYFMDEEEFVTNLDLYVDRGHYAPEVNDYIMECFGTTKHLVTKDNYQEIPARMNQILEAYDYDTILDTWSWIE